MENSAHRRLERVSGHLLSPIEVNNGLSQVLIKGGHRKHEEEGDPVVIGGMVLDIHATPSLPLNPRTTTPGKDLKGVDQNNTAALEPTVRSIGVEVQQDIEATSDTAVLKEFQLGLKQ
ncbi:hypothetical protein POTOM_017660 [Populus tomentosa]|uniref:Uncharacterized protein n=1 Tax=Populus tomentosa TaxID=118781 RepID=A0A8X7ZVB7_POPTO|nr:hypothetical protein POTOM_017660 [Populus tomentosa]